MENYLASSTLIDTFVTVLYTQAKNLISKLYKIGKLTKLANITNIFCSSNKRINFKKKRFPFKHNQAIE